MLLKPRPYQEEADAAFKLHFETERRGACALPTGMGKTVIFAHLALHYLKLRPLILVDRDVLVQQAIDRLHSVAPDLTIGVIKASRNELGRDITIASVQTLSRIKRLHAISSKAFRFIIVDECHHSAADSYLRIIEYFGGFKEGCSTEDGAIVAGFTATLIRNDSKSLNPIWGNKPVYTKDILWGIRHKYLCDVRGKRVVVDGLDLSGVKKSGKDFSDTDLGRVLDEAHIGNVMLKGYLEHGENRPTIGFLPTVGLAHDCARIFHEAGIRSAVIDANTSTEDRNLIFKMVKAGEIQVLFNFGVLVEGLDIPELSCLLMGRPTQSTGLYIQIVGRILRTWIGKTDALVLDFVGASEDHRLATLTDLSPALAKVREGESLIEAEERQRGEVESRKASGTGEIVDVHDVDLFGGRSSLWLRTFRGYWFISAGDRIYCLLPEDVTESTFTVGYFWNGSGRRQSNARLATAMTLDYGMAHCEEMASEYSPDLTRRAASWRKKKEPPTQAQIWKAKQLRIENPEEYRKSELSDRISITIASGILDRWKPK